MLICPTLLGCNNSKPAPKPEITYTVKFKMNHIDYTSSLVPANQIIQENGQVRKPLASEYESTIINTDHDKYTFKYWSKEVDGDAYDFSSQVTSSFTLYAVWNKFPALTISYVRNTEDYPSDASWPDSIPAIYGEKAKCPSEDAYISTFLTKKNDKRYIFKYWSKDPEGKEKYNFDEIVTKSLTLYAIWETRIVHTVTFIYRIAGIVLSPWPSNQYIDDGYYVREPTPNVEYPKSGCSHDTGLCYEFEYWLQDGHEERFEFEKTKVTSDITIAARYECHY